MSASVMMALMVVVFPLSQRNMNSYINLTMICNENQHNLDVRSTSNKSTLACKNFCARLACAFPAKKIRLFARTLIVEFSKVAISTGYSCVNGSGNTIVTLGERTKVIISA